ncbi:MAG: hypothetical protein LW817_00285, partial [Candidatus Caenarcaniphilales bacterium]|nr:hypothetical protein [Candidatus Caenarcaniphilales bacterium]
NTSQGDYEAILAKGEIPQEILEILRSNDRQDPINQKFTKQVTDFIKPMFEALPKDALKIADMDFGTYDFEKNPIRFLIGDSNEANACSITGSIPPTIVINKGCFTQDVTIPIFDAEGKATNKTETVKFIENPADLAVLVCHEICHANLRIQKGQNVLNSKFEEGAFYALPIKFIHDNGMDNVLGIRALNKIAELVKTQRRNPKKPEWAEFADEHPLPENIQKIALDTRAGILHMQGAKEQVSVDRSELYNQIAKTAEGFKHRRYLDIFLPVHYDHSLNAIGKIQAIGRLLQLTGNPYPIRLADINQEIRRIAKEEVGNLPQDATTKKQLSQAVDTCVEALLRHSTIQEFHIVFNSIYSGLSQTVHPRSHEVKPMGPLKAIDALMAEICDSCATLLDQANDTQAKKALVEASQKLVEIVESSKIPKELLRAIKWTNFELPEADEIERVRNSKKNKKKLSAYPIISWQPMVEMAKTNKDVFKAACLMGLGQDHELLALLVNFQDTNLTDCNDPFSYQIDSLKRRDSTAIQELVTKTSEISGKRFATSTKYVGSSFTPLIEAQRANKKHLMELDPSTKLKIQNTDDIEFDYLICEDSFETNCRQASINNLQNLTETAYIKVGRELVATWRKLIAKDRAQYRPIITSILNDVTYARARQWELESSFEPNGYRPYRLNADPILRYVLENPDAIFDQEMKDRYTTNCLLTKDWNATTNSFDSNEPETIITDLKSLKRYYPEADLITNISETLAKYQDAKTSEVDKAIIRLKTIEFLKRDHISYEEISKATEIDYSTEIGKAQQHQALILTNIDQYCKNKNAKEILAEVLKFHRYKLLRSGDKLDQLINLVLSKLSKAVTSVKLETLEMLLASNISYKPELENKAIDLYTSSCINTINKAKKNQQINKAKPYIDWITSNTSRRNHRAILQSLLNKLEAQEDLCKYAKESIDKNTIGKDELGLKGLVLSSATEILLSTQSSSKNCSQDALKFFSAKYNQKKSETLILGLLNIFYDSTDYSSVEAKAAIGDQEMCKELIDAWQDDFKHSDPKNKSHCQDLKRQLIEDFRLIHEHYWAAPLVGRSYMTRELLLAGEENPDHSKIFDKAIDIMVNKNTPDRKHIVQLLDSYLSSLDHSQRDLALSAMISSSPKDPNSKTRIGEALAMFLENMGPAETKLGQCAQSHPKVPKDIRSDLKRLKYRANEPYRWEIVADIEALKNQIADSYTKNLKSKAGIKDLDQHGRVYVKNIGQVLGSGSLFVAVELTMSDGSTQVISVKRPYALERAKYGFETLGRMVDKLEAGPVKETLAELVKNARAKLDIEVDCLIAQEQYDAANKLYEGTSVELDDGSKFEFSSAKVTAQGGGFYMMNKAEGAHFAEIADDQKTDSLHLKKLSKAILTLEISNILKGRFCNDRHGGNIKITGNKINNIDFKALSLKGFPQGDYDQFAEILLKVVLAADEIKSSDDFINKFLEIQGQIRDEAAEIKPLVSEIQKALLSTTEYSSLLNPEELMQVLLSAISDGMSPQMKIALDKQVDKLPVFIKPFVSAFLSNGTLPGVDFKPIKIHRKTTFAA